MSSHDHEIGAVLFFGNPMEVIPRRLIAASTLTHEEKICWMAVKVLSEHNRVHDLETCSQLAQMLYNDPNRMEPLQDVLIKLRLGRWITRCGESVAGSSLYGIHDEVASIKEVMRLDPDYPALVDASTQHEREDIRQLALAIQPQLLPSPVADAG
ncbi:hypothetical protein BVH03_17605 [Pseudomonas sp. PA15(2017)]|uniref:hypothetical protein n=1 Tax=Pseudomonas sp. PA15(2017) TaxID=1932111 RepID=UPI000969851D|nr:hypothetical protein [Pseudomonas sp. PA15(2017)]OLU25472.1 hypothetical protein BVH03_17605 [Pseudomonas sp. PA15(2017)]